MRAIRRRGAGFTLFEVTVVICVVALLAAIGAERMLRYAELAEQSGMETTVSTLRSALALQFAARYLRGDRAGIDALASQNPFEWLARQPENYLGVLQGPGYAGLARGAWYFDPVRREAVYLPQRTRYLVADAADPAIRFAARVVFAPVAAEGKEAVLQSLDMAPVRPYRWILDSGWREK